MSKDNPPCTPNQNITGGLNEPEIIPTQTIHTTEGLGNANSEPGPGDLVMQFVVQNFDKMNAMYTAFTQKRKDVQPRQLFTTTEPPIVEPWNSDSDDVHPSKAKDNTFVESENMDPTKNQAATGATPLINTTMGKAIANTKFYHEPFVFKESDKDVRDLVASLFSKRIRDYDMCNTRIFFFFFGCYCSPIIQKSLFLYNSKITIHRRNHYAFVKIIIKLDFVHSKYILNV